MPEIVFKDVTMIYPFVSTRGLFNRKERKALLEKQKRMPYTSNEGVVAVQHFSATIKDGEFVVIIGQSGSGKSTLLRLVAGLERPALGEIYFDDECLNGKNPEDRDVAMVFQNYSLYPNQSVFDNIAFPLRNQHLTRDEIDEKVLDMIDLLKLTGKENRFPEELSGGERQRVAIARALVRKPKVFLLDEPFSNLDELMKNSLRAEIKRIQRELGITFIYVTHDQKDALLLADRIMIMENGILRQDDTAIQVYNYPKDLFCAQFVGYPPMNVFRNVPIKGNMFIFGGKEYKLSSGQMKQIGKDKSLILGVRPFNIEITPEGAPAVVDASEIDGNDLLTYVDFEGQDVTIVEKNLNQVGLKYLRGQEVCLTFDSDYFYLFKENEKSIR